MEYLGVLIGCLMTIVIMYFVFGINIRKIKEAGKNKKLDEIVNRFPENKEICENILKSMNNSKTKIKENTDKDNKTSLYVAVSDTIFIANIRDSYTRVQTIAHECLHSIQDRKMLIFNFIYSNVYIFYFIMSAIFIIFRVFHTEWIQIVILMSMGFIYYVVRSYLETDAMTKAKYVAQDYINKYVNENQICTKEEVEEIVNEYEKINKIGIPATNYILFVNCIIKVAIIAVLAIIF